MPSAPDRCIFCTIAADAPPSDGPAGGVVLAEDRFVAFLDIRPVFKGHTLVVPRTHRDTLLDVPAEDHGPLLATVQRIAAAVTSGTGAQGTFVAVNNVVSQSVPHLHVHVVPRTKGDGLRGFFWPRTTYAGDEELHATATAIRAALAPGVA